MSDEASTIPCLVESVLKRGSTAAPAVTVSWAQSLDGAIAAAEGKRTTLSGPESLTLTHRLRSLHRAILVGIGTVISDDPQLTVRLVQGPSPQPVVLDSFLRFPLGAQLLARRDRAPWIFHAAGAPSDKAKALELRGAVLFPLSSDGATLPLAEVLRILGTHSIDSVMVEGGARVLRSFITGRMAQQAVITVSPVRMDGISIFEAGRNSMPAFAESRQEQFGRDSVTWGRFA
ncbi:MAG TPA: RibD family protein [Spirochaetia bacterium]|nr:RibD family protein [Spirochaetia bacterium]